MSTHPPNRSKPAVAAAAADLDALPAGTRFGEFEIVRVLGVGGFGIVYLAHDHSLERAVALKEYMPASLAARGVGPQITVRSSAYAETYAIGLRSFINEARLLARFDHPSLVKVYRFWEDNATAYMVMPFLQGVTLRDARRAMAHAPGEAWIRSVVAPILSALELLHRQGVYHRDVAPDNILLPRDGAPVLLDFGAARRVISDRTQSLTAILKPSYAPIEQYAEMLQLRQGPWTDLYALGAVIHYLVFGVAPAPATARAVAEDGDTGENRVVAGISPRLLQAMSWMLAVRPQDRPQSGEQLRAVLEGRSEIPARVRAGTTLPPAVVAPEALVETADAQGVGTRSPGADASGASATRMQIAHAEAAGEAGTRAQAPGAEAAGAALAGTLLSSVQQTVPSVPPSLLPRSAAPAQAPAIVRSRRWIALAGATFVIALAVAAAMQLAGRRGATMVAAPAPAPASAATAGVVPLPATVPMELSTAPSEIIIESEAPGEPVARVPLAEPGGAAAGAARTRLVGRSSSRPDEAGASRGTPSASTLRRAVPGGAPATVREACAGKQGFIARAVCMDERCEEPQFRAVGECPAILARKRQREH